MKGKNYNTHNIILKNKQQCLELNQNDEYKNILNISIL